MNRRYIGAVAGAVLGAIVGATVGGLVGRLIALVGDETVSAVVPMAVCAVLGYIFGAASGAKGSLDRIGAERSMAGSVLAGLILVVSVVAGVALGSDTVAVFIGFLLGGLVLSGVAAAVVAGPGRPKAVTPVAEAARAPKLEVTRQTVRPAGDQQSSRRRTAAAHPPATGGRRSSGRRMNEPDIDVLCVGNAIVDVLAYADDGFLAEHGLVKGSMRLVDAQEASELYKNLPPGVEASGGSAGNTAVGVAGLGGRAAFIGRVGDDQLGAVFTHDIRNAGVRFQTPPAEDGPPTAQCLVVVTPDAQRTMSTYLGASQLLGPDDVDEALVARAAVTYLEGYLDPPEAKEAFRAAMAAARAAQRRVAFSLSDAFCVDRFRDEFLDLLAGPVDVMFANESEACSLFEVDSLELALRQLSGMCEMAVVTRGADGSTVLAAGERIDVAAAPIDKVVDTTGAGDLYAAGFLYGLTSALDLRACAELGGRCAAAVLGHLGPRPQASLRDLL